MLRTQRFAVALAAILLLSASLLNAQITSKVYLPVMVSLPPNLTETTSCFSEVTPTASPPEHAPGMGRPDIWVSADYLRRLP